jgi:hypothetical protein
MPVDKLSVKSGELILQTSVGESKELSPYSYQFTSNAKVNVDCRYIISGNVVKIFNKEL